MNESERRKIERFDLKLPTKLYCTGKGKAQESIELVTSNVCAGGAYLMTSSPLPKGVRVKIELDLQFGRLNEFRVRPSIVDVSGYVVRSDHQGMAICFDRKYKILPYSTIDT